MKKNLCIFAMIRHIPQWIKKGRASHLESHKKNALTF